MSKRFELTPEQIAISEERKAKKQKLQTQPPPTPINVDAGLILPRPWLNLSAQCLVRRELFPTSNCLKGAQRQPMLHAEVLAQNADIMCLQEVDSLEKLLPTLEAAQYNYHYVAGPGKKHGCLIRVIYYDEQHVRSEGDEKVRRGSSFRTRNIGSIVALKNISNEGEGVVIGTTHLFWHPKYTYERTRQAGILIREITKFRSELHLENWPCMIAGAQTTLPTPFLVGGQLNAEQRDRLEISRVVHVSIDPTVPPTTKAAPVDDESGAVDPDRVITNARSAVHTDGLLSDSELVSLFSSANVVRSTYDEGLKMHTQASPGFPTFGDRMSLSRTSKGYYEPEYTSYTHYWKAHYIFILTDRPAVVGGLLAPHIVKDLVPGLPQKGISGSDHISLCADIILPPITGSAENSEGQT
ncbi:Endonuclease/exonuclease/phosphatase [Mycena alexandri]|uniref:Endonuclease/exonuclease/phosphatase n=1 Tax=Mycena alexandri TaxID=1745969 RepID=A0AAD6X7T2_9AGAR|nr:Endonuclease/exonuclease/phosphatase [Mycena alexandri]